MRTLIENTSTEIQNPDLHAGYVYEGAFVDQRFYDEIGQEITRDGKTFVKKVLLEEDIETVNYYHAYTPEEIAQREQAEAEAAHQELIDALPDAVADLSVMVSDNSIDTADLQDAIAELSEIVSGLME